MCPCGLSIHCHPRAVLYRCWGTPSVPSCQGLSSTWGWAVVRGDPEPPDPEQGSDPAHPLLSFSLLAAAAVPPKPQPAPPAKADPSLILRLTGHTVGLFGGFFPSNRLNSSFCAWLPGGEAAAVPGSALPLSLPPWAGLEPALSGGMGSASPGLSALPPGRLAWPDPALLPPPRDPRSWGCPESPSPPSTPEQPLPAFCLHYFDMLYPEDTAWAAKGTGEPSHSSAQGGREEARKEPEQCPIIDSQGLGLGPEGDLQDSLHLEEHSLEQVQSMVVGEVLKDIETACKLLNIAAGGCSAGAAGGDVLGAKGTLHSRGCNPV